MNKKPKMLRVITDGRVIPWHLEKTLRDLDSHFEIIIAGENASKFIPFDAEYRSYDIPLNPKIRLFDDFICLIKLIKILLTERPVIIHSIMPKAGLMAALASFFIVPLRFHTFTGQVWSTKSGLSRFVLKAIDKLIILLNTKCLTDSPSQSQFLLSESVRDKNKEPLMCLLKGSLGGVDLKKIDILKKDIWNRAIRQKHGIPSSNIVIGYLARKTEDKGAFLYLQLCKNLIDEFRNLSFVFVGPDDSGGTVTNILNSDEHLRRNIICVDQVNNHEEYIASFNILCLPSFREGFGSIVIDSAALSVPTVGSNIPGLVDAIIDNETGVLFEPGNIENLTNVTRKLIVNPDHLIKLGENARVRVLTYYDSQILSKNLLDFYESYLLKAGIK
jgi:glycosyltransferase involved in cell wall biosynthesis